MIVILWRGGVILLAAVRQSDPATGWAGSAQSMTIDDNDIGGVVTGPNGPEAGVWVIAESTELPTKFARMVVTNDQGRYVLPDLPEVGLPGLGARLWPCQLTEDAWRTRSDAGPDRRGRARRQIGRALLPGDLLVLDAPHPRGASEFGSNPDLPEGR